MEIQSRASSSLSEMEAQKARKKLNISSQQPPAKVAEVVPKPLGTKKSGATKPAPASTGKRLGPAKKFNPNGGSDSTANAKDPGKRKGETYGRRQNARDGQTDEQQKPSSGPRSEGARGKAKAKTVKPERSEQMSRMKRMSHLRNSADAETCAERNAYAYAMREFVAEYHTMEELLWSAIAKKEPTLNVRIDSLRVALDYVAECSNYEIGEAQIPGSLHTMQIAMMNAQRACHALIELMPEVLIVEVEPEAEPEPKVCNTISDEISELVLCPIDKQVAADSYWNHKWRSLSARFEGACKDAVSDIVDFVCDPVPIPIVCQFHVSVLESTIAQAANVVSAALGVVAAEVRFFFGGSEAMPRSQGKMVGRVGGGYVIPPIVEGYHDNIYEWVSFHSCLGLKDLAYQCYYGDRLATQENATINASNDCLKARQHLDKECISYVMNFCTVQEVVDVNLLAREIWENVSFPSVGRFCDSMWFCFKELVDVREWYNLYKMSESVFRAELVLVNPEPLEDRDTRLPNYEDDDLYGQRVFSMYMAVRVHRQVNGFITNPILYLDLARFGLESYSNCPTFTPDQYGTEMTMSRPFIVAESMLLTGASHSLNASTPESDRYHRFVTMCRNSLCSSESHLSYVSNPIFLDSILLVGIHTHQDPFGVLEAVPKVK
jgi:hypothetical protein